MGRALLQQDRNVSWTGRFLVGRASRGCWVVLDREHRVGGLFCDRSAALHFAKAESGRAPDAVCCAGDDEIVSFDLVPANPQPRRRGLWPGSADMSHKTFRGLSRRV